MRIDAISSYRQLLSHPDAPSKLEAIEAKALFTKIRLSQQLFLSVTHVHVHIQS